MDERTDTASPAIASGEKAKARDILAAIKTLQQIEREHCPATAEERQVLGRFGGFGSVALGIFPDPVTGCYKDAGWQALGDELKSLLTEEEYASARRTVFSQFFTSPVVMQAMHAALAHLGVPDHATVLEPGCGTGRFLTDAPAGQRFIGVELDSISGRIARVLHPSADIRIENFRDTKLPEGSVDAVIGNPPFADVKIDYRGRKLPLHDFCIAKSLDAVKPGGILALVTSHYTLDELNASAREDLAEKADFLEAIRLPSDAFKREGTSVVTDILILRKRASGEPARHADPDWLSTGTLSIDGAEVTVNRYFLNHPEQVLGTWSRQDTLYGTDGFSVLPSGNLGQQLREAIARLPQGQVLQSPSERPNPPPVPAFVPPPPQRHIAEGSFFVADDKIIHQVEGGQGVPVV
jgi:SAM-dependent methyltransferase